MVCWNRGAHLTYFICDVTKALKYDKYIEKLKLIVRAVHMQITFIRVNRMVGGLYYII